MSDTSLTMTKSFVILLAIVPLAIAANGSQPPEMARPPWHHPLLVCQGDPIPYGAVVLARGMADEDWVRLFCVDRFRPCS